MFLKRKKFIGANVQKTYHQLSVGASLVIPGRFVLNAVAKFLRRKQNKRIRFDPDVASNEKIKNYFYKI